MYFSEQPGRIIAIFFIAPFLLWCGYRYENKILIVLSIVFFFYELFWIILYNPKKIYIIYNDKNINDKNINDKNINE